VNIMVILYDLSLEMTHDDDDHLSTLDLSFFR
jgi:hypothetical protein